MATEKDEVLEQAESLENQSVDETNAVENDSSSAEHEPISTEESRVQEEIESLKQQLLRTHADFDNFRRRTRQEKEDLQQFATRKLIEDLLPTVDNFDRALSTLNEAEHAEMKKGIEMVHRQLVSVLEKHGVQAMATTDAPFDPNFHEAVMQEPADGREVGIVVQELQKGYTLNGKVVRPAMVKVTV